VFVETSSQFIRPLGLACMCVPYCCTEYASSGVSSATHTFQGRLEEAGGPYHMSTGNYTGTGHHKCQQGSWFQVGSTVWH